MWSLTEAWRLCAVCCDRQVSLAVEHLGQPVAERHLVARARRQHHHHVLGSDPGRAREPVDQRGEERLLGRGVARLAQCDRDHHEVVAARARHVVAIEDQLVALELVNRLEAIGRRYQEGVDQRAMQAVRQRLEILG